MMGKILKFLFERIVDPLGLPIEAWKEYLIIFMLGEIAYIIAFYVVGGMYKNHIISTSADGSIFHWGIRLIVFVIMWAITYCVVWLVQFLEAYIWWIIGGLGTTTLILVVIRICINLKYGKLHGDK